MSDFFVPTFPGHPAIRKLLVGKVTFDYSDFIIRFFNMSLNEIIVYWEFPTLDEYLEAIDLLKNQQNVKI